jgi:hypothetical protein
MLTSSGLALNQVHVTQGRPRVDDHKSRNNLPMNTKLCEHIQSPRETDIDTANMAAGTAAISSVREMTRTGLTGAWPVLQST